ADADDRDLVCSEVVLRQQQAQRQRTRGPWRRDADLQPDQVLRGFVGGRLFLRERNDDAERIVLQGDGGDGLAACLQVEGVFIGAGDEIDAARHQRLERIRAATAEIVELDRQPLLLEVAL